MIVVRAPNADLPNTASFKSLGDLLVQGTFQGDYPPILYPYQRILHYTTG